MTGDTTALIGEDDGDPRPSGEQLLSSLESRLISGRWPVGSRLPGERALAEEFGVSRPILREALRDLQTRGFLSITPGRGTFVRSLRPTSGEASLDLLAREGIVTARHLIVARRMLECQAVALATDNHTPDDAARMAELLSALQEQARDPSAAAVLDVAFHESIIIAAANPVLNIMFGSIRALVRGIVLRSLTDRLVNRLGVPQHEVILTAILDRDREAAITAMADHLTIAEQHYGTDLDRPLGEILERRARQFPRLADLLRDAGHQIKKVT
ncbi:FadR/GntR family transcriptional regulator [Nonomuraea sp. NPDC050536]|uniref:FadR/GntR family transcriptional regulator n=1 Tax=Nonomuraea sp. NPDC050536 TaxID=3364366 RepID=UPI0037C8EB4A